MNKWLMKLKQNKEQIILTVIFGCFPLICALVYGLMNGHSIGDVYLPASYWNDELFYFKQVEAVVNYGLPQGWFGFQEMHGSVYPFAAWSPAVLIPYIVWGRLFGWKLTAMFFICILITLARPYLILLMALPAWLLIRKKKFTGAAIAFVIAAATAVGYFVVTELCSSPYFIPLIETDWLNSMINDGFLAGMKTMCRIVREKFRLLITHHLYRGFKYGLLSGALHAVAGTIAFLLGARRERWLFRWPILRRAFCGWPPCCGPSTMIPGG